MISEKDINIIVEKCMIVLVNANKAFDKIQLLFMVGIF